MAMAASDALVCPACGARNKPKWEFCVRCGESLQDAQTAAPLAKTVVKGRGKGKSKLTIQIHEREAESSFPPGLIVGIGALLLVGLAVAGWRYASTYKGAPPADPSLFTVATLPVAPPAAAPVTGPGASDYEEGRKLLAQGRAAEAVVLLARAAAAAPSNPRFQWGYGEALVATGAADNGLARFADAVHLAPGEFRLPYARALDRAGRSADAAAAYEEVIGAEPSNLVVQEDLGHLYYRSGDFAKAAPFLEKAVGARGGDPVLRQELAYSVEKSGDKARAAQLYREVLGLAPGADVSRSHLAALVYEQGKSDEAVTILKEGVARDPNIPSLRRDLGNMLERMGKTQDAIREYKEYARLAPNAPDAKELAERAARLEGPGKS
jgi:Flp pilus assembly protein TadD